MENARLDVTPIEQTEQELLNLFTTDSPGLPLGQVYRAADSFAKVSDEFKAAQGKVKVLDVLTFEDWMTKFRQSLLDRRLDLDLVLRRIISRRQIYKYVLVGRYIVPRISEPEFRALGGIEKAAILADVAEVGRLTPDLLKAAAECTLQKLKENVAPLLGKEVTWDKHLGIDSHEAAVASLIVMGNRLGYKTYTAHPAHKFEGQELRDMATTIELPRFATEQIMRSVNRIDVVWLKDDYPEYFFEVENSTDVTSGLHRMFQAVKYGEQFFIVGPKEVKGRFLREIQKSPFKNVKEKYYFRSYNQLRHMFHAARRYCDAHGDFFEKQE
jgi:hypothetical protein